MAERLRLVSGREAVSKLQRAGWTLVRRRGSHMMLTHPAYRWTLSVPPHTVRRRASIAAAPATRSANVAGSGVFR